MSVTERNLIWKLINIYVIHSIVYDQFNEKWYITSEINSLPGFCLQNMTVWYRNKSWHWFFFCWYMLLLQLFGYKWWIQIWMLTSFWRRHGGIPCFKVYFLTYFLSFGFFILWENMTTFTYREWTKNDEYTVYNIQK